MKRIITILLVALIPMMAMSQGVIPLKPPKKPIHQIKTDGKKNRDNKGKSKQKPASTPETPEQLYQRGLTCFEAEDYDEAVKCYRKAAAHGHADAQFCLGYCYTNGQGVSQDYVEAAYWYRKAAAQENTNAQTNLGHCYEYGQGVSQDYVEAAKWYRKAAELGNVLAQYNLGVCYEFGQGVGQDHVEAAKWYRKAAEQGDADALYKLGLCFETGQGVSQNLTDAEYCYNKAAEQGDTRAQDRLRTISGHEWVDLGLSVKWATCNIGASSPSDYGDYFAWGETSTKSKYTEKNSKTFKKNMNDFMYVKQYDAARSQWGGNWRMPTQDEIEELAQKCQWEWTTQEGHTGYLVTSKTNGNSIFLPASGWRSGSSTRDVGKSGLYWCTTPGGYLEYACCLDFNSLTHGADWRYRSLGLPVRPVTD